MKDDRRRRAARKVAQEYAPHPESGVVMYGVVGIVLAGLAFIAFSRFYDFEMLSHPAWGFSLVAIGLLGAIYLWFVRKSRHNTAHRKEYEDML